MQDAKKWNVQNKDRNPIEKASKWIYIYPEFQTKLLRIQAQFSKIQETEPNFFPFIMK